VTRHRFVGLVLVFVAFAGVGCTPDPTAPAQLDVTTIEVVCGGAYNPDVPPCRSNPASRAVVVKLGTKVVASGTTGADGHLTLTVPVGDLVVSDPDAQPYMNCDSPAVTSVADTTTAVTQTCTLLAP